MVQVSEYDLHTANGATPLEEGPGAVTVPAPGPRLPRREVWIDLPEEYPGFRARVWVNYPRRLNDELRTTDPARLTAVLRQLVLEHNGWCDTDGTPFPPAADLAFWDVIPDELAAVVLTLMLVQAGKLAASVMPRSAR